LLKIVQDYKEIADALCDWALVSISSVRNKIAYFANGSASPAVVTEVKKYSVQIIYPYIPVQETLHPGTHFEIRHF
jgi:hypothetical protein